ncbi:YrbL family protein [Winogradskyella bathintestinalis]|uniref:YrbL family protein n=1 Tax=Winogradskyella bathintestinalis TaxID=3035208 RepID=A0ABT7ZWN9_9FLAO|nr:YrbL family protein [Winogradskyella bathintestinalis]MDN3493430.1 YrbL family protein [Winogradskyella bathintestinalis]
MLQIKDKNYISEGLARKVYFHPDNNDLCVKIGKPEIDTHHLYKEINYLEKIKSKDRSKFAYPFFAEYLGEIETNLGTGFIYELVKDELSQNISLTLRHYLEMNKSSISDTQIEEGLQRLKEQMISHKIFVGDLRARNICVKLLKNNAIELVVIDGIGHRDFFPFADWFHYFAKKKVERRFVKANLHSLSAQRNLIKRLRASGETIV